MKQTKPLVLVVDNNPGNMKSLGHLLFKNGYDPAIARNSLQALYFIERNQPDLILLDIVIPGMNGYDICRKIKTDTSTRHIPVIFLTARRKPSDKIKGFDAGCIDYVTRPFHTQELLARIKAHIEMKISRDFIPICSHCKMVRDKQGYWDQLDAYLETHTDILFTHSLCPGCATDLYGDRIREQSSKMTAT